MNGNEIQAYAAALEQVVELRKRVAKIAESLSQNEDTSREGGLLANRPTRIMIVNCEARFSSNVALSDSPVIDAAKIPDGEQVGAMVSELHTAIEAAQDAYEAIPKQFRAGVASPPNP